MDIEHQNAEESRSNDKNVIHSYDEALSECGFGKFHALLLLTCGLCLMSTIVETLNIGFVIPLIDMECEVELSLSEKGILNSAAFVGVVSSSLFWGFLADWKRGGRKKVMHWCAFSAFLFSLISAFSLNAWMLIITRFGVGFFISGISANTYAYLGEFHCEKNRARQLSFAGVFMAFALTFCPALAWIILTFKPIATISFVVPLLGIKFAIWRLFLLTTGFLSGTVAILLCLLPESPKFLLAQERHDEALSILRSIHQRNKKPGHIFAVNAISLDELLLERTTQTLTFCQQVVRQTSPLLKPPLRIRTINTSFIMFSLFAASSGFFLWTPDILNILYDYRDQNSTVCDVVDEVVRKKKIAIYESPLNSCLMTPVDRTVYEITFFMGVFFSLVYFFNGLVISKIGKKNLLAFWFALCGVGGALIPLSTNYHITLLLMVIFLTCGVCGSILSAILVDLFPTNVRAMSLCVVLMIGRLGAVAGSNFVSFVLVRQCELMFGLFGGLLLASAIVSLLLPEK